MSKRKNRKLDRDRFLVAQQLWISGLPRQKLSWFVFAWVDSCLVSEWMQISTWNVTAQAIETKLNVVVKHFSVCWHSFHIYPQIWTTCKKYQAEILHSKGAATNCVSISINLCWEIKIVHEFYLQNQDAIKFSLHFFFFFPFFSLFFPHFANSLSPHPRFCRVDSTPSIHTLYHMAAYLCIYSLRAEITIIFELNFPQFDSLFLSFLLSFRFMLVEKLCSTTACSAWIFNALFHACFAIRTRRASSTLSAMS